MRRTAEYAGPIIMSLLARTIQWAGPELTWEIATWLFWGAAIVGLASVVVTNMWPMVWLGMGVFVLGLDTCIRDCLPDVEAVGRGE
jgi:hypothetical protein